MDYIPYSETQRRLAEMSQVPNDELNIYENKKRKIGEMVFDALNRRFNNAVRYLFNHWLNKFLFFSLFVCI